MRKAFSTDSLKSTATETTQAVKCVRFSEKIHFRKTLSRQEYTLEETEAAWSSREERQQISTQRREEIKKINYGEKFKDNKYCIRGLEGLTKIGKVSKARTRALCTSAVLNEQLIQWEECVLDENTIADVYHTLSSSCQLWAYVVGRRDHKVAKEIHESSHGSSSFMRVSAGRVR